MTDVLEMLSDANPVKEDALSPSFEAVWRTLDHDARRQRGHVRIRRPLMLGGAASVLGAVALALLLMFAGGAPSTAQAFPILRTRGVDLSEIGRLHRGLAQWLTSPAAIEAATEDAHPFPIADGTGYVIESPDGSTLCLTATATAGPTAGRGWVFGCGPTADIEQDGNILSFGFTADDLDFIALVPTGATVALTDDGTTTQVPVTGGIATGVVHDNATLTVQVGQSVTTRQLDFGSVPASPARGAGTTTGMFGN